MASSVAFISASAQPGVPAHTAANALTPAHAPSAVVASASAPSHVNAYAAAAGVVSVAAAQANRRRKPTKRAQKVVRAAAGDALSNHSTKVFNDEQMLKACGEKVMSEFKEALLSGKELSKDARKSIASGMLKWARGHGATHFAHWFFPCRMGGGAPGGTLAALKYDSFVDLVWDSDSVIKPFEEAFHPDRLFVGETDGSSFPNGGLRATHTAAAFTTWDRSSPPFIVDGVMRVPCSFVTHYGKCIDLKTPLLRANDAVSREGMRLLKHMDLKGKKATAAKGCLSYVGWEQEFFVVGAEEFKQRPDLVNCGRTLFGALPTRNQQTDQLYFSPPPVRVQELSDIVEQKMFEIGVPMAVKHNEVAPGQYEMSPIFTASSASCDQNVIFMEMCTMEAAKLGLAVLFHEKPFANINGSGKHNNWSVMTDNGINFFHPGKDDDERLCNAVGLAALAYGLHTYSELVRISVAHAGNDHRLGAQEAPPAIISFYPGIGFEEHVDNIIKGGELLGFEAEKKKQGAGCTATEAIDTNVEDRNRTAPFPFCSNRFEFRAVGSSQNCMLPTAVCNTIWSAGAAHISEQIEGGKSLRDAVADTFEECRNVIFTGDGYSADWPIEAEKRGLPNLNTTPLAINAFAGNKKCQEALVSMDVYSPEECEALSENMYENYIATLTIEAETMIQMVNTGFLAAFARDLAVFKDAPELAGDRKALYSQVKAENEALKELMTKMPEGLSKQSEYLCDVVKPQMEALRQLVDKAEGHLEKDIYPYPTYETLIYGHHF